MPEIAEVMLMMDTVRELTKSLKLIKINIISGKYKNGKQSIKMFNELSESLPILIKSVKTKGKFSWIHLKGGWYIWITFGMSGSIKREIDSHSRIEFELSDGTKFYFSDARNFGNIVCSNKEDLRKKINEIGPDLLNNNLDDNEMINRFRTKCKSNKNVCQALMEQKILSGIGNYIKSECLYRAKINPNAKIGNLSDLLLSELYHHAQDIAKESYNVLGASIYTYTDSNRKNGKFQDMLKVYNCKEDPDGNKISQLTTPDKRNTFWVKSVQYNGV